ncbi:uncharacterized protein LOC108906059 isoform X2 [Anoplophora glabripennis]|uniref:uncharacterized protein LOC108906059 isoform X2 n=1 Tax=Anoplophora glabripennis TaxID=217634 RepID=UPI000873674B|nr:uncharacterized protein LOC108906059 isoform X2 [Anoplophora glabripennis]
MDKRVYLIFVLNFFCVYAALSITEVRGPNSVEYGSTEDVILDCDFEATDERDLEIKWFYNGNDQVIYQWIPDSNKPGYAMGQLKDHIDVQYVATNDSNTRYRALRIFDVNMNLTGNYTCKVSSYLSEDTKTKQLIVYIPAQSGLEATLMEDEKIVSCSTSGVFPKPEMNIYLYEGNNKTDISNSTGENFIEYNLDENEYYNLTAIYFFPNLEDFPRNTKFVCELTIPGTDYLEEKAVIYQGDNSAAIHSPGVRLSAMLAFLLLILCK